MRKKRFSFKFKGGEITVWAFNKAEAEILAKAEAIYKGWDYTMIK